jgi:hypothetical protein
VSWGRDRFGVIRYVEMNFAEAIGFTAYTFRKYRSTA